MLIASYNLNLKGREYGAVGRRNYRRHAIFISRRGRGRSSSLGFRPRVKSHRRRGLRRGDRRHTLDLGRRRSYLRYTLICRFGLDAWTRREPELAVLDKNRLQRQQQNTEGDEHSPALLLFESRLWQGAANLRTAILLQHSTNFPALGARDVLPSMPRNSP